MISWLKGQIIQNWHLSSKKGVVLNVGGIGYEIQLLSKQLATADNTNASEFWIHQINREDCTKLYGFSEISQRDLFRQIIGVNGVGPQIGMALLEEFEVDQLVEAIERGDLKLLTKSQGIGKRIAERLVVELKNKLQHFTITNKTSIDNEKENISNDFYEYIDEIKSILNSLGYVENEIKESIKFLEANKEENTLLINSLSLGAKKALLDKHLKQILISLSQKDT